MRASLEQHLGSRQVGKVVYGSIIGLALVVAIESHPPQPGRHGGLAGRARRSRSGSRRSTARWSGARRAPGSRSRARTLGAPGGGRRAPSAFGVAFPAVFFLLAALGFMEVETAFRLAKWTGLGLIGFYGYWAARFAGLDHLTGPCSRALWWRWSGPG